MPLRGRHLLVPVLAAAALSFAACTDDGAADAGVVDGQPVKVTGLVRVFDKPFLEKEYDVVFTDPRLEEWSGDHVLVANLVEPLVPS